jgi:formylglycine-generating enzyme required for sulfatase activity
MVFQRNRYEVKQPTRLAMFIRLLITFALLTALPAQAARQALVIGNDNYTSARVLFKAGNDATAMARELKAAGFAVQVHRDLGYRSMVRVVENFTAGVKGGDEVVVFFAGHGVQIKAGPYLLPTDIEATTEGEVQQTAYELNLLTEKLSSAKPAFVLVIVDACRDNPLKAKSNDRSLGETRGLSAIEPPKGQMVVFSASKGQKALDRLSDKDANPNSVFTREFIARMNRPGVRIQDLMEEVRDAVEALAGTVQHEQRPSLTNEARGNFYFFEPTKVQVASVKPEPIESPAQIEQQGWAAALSGNTEAGYAAYLREYPQGRYVAAARIALASLQGKSAADKAVDDKQAAAKIAADKAAAERATAAKVLVDKITAERVAEDKIASDKVAADKLAADKAAAEKGVAPVAGQVTKDCTDCPEMVMIPAGGFDMGSNENVAEQPVHRVNVPAFFLGRTEVTEGQWIAVMGKNSGRFSDCGADCPVENISWNEAQEFARRLSNKTGKTYRLPSEAEWEYAARAGSNGKWSFGDDESQLAAHAWFGRNSGRTKHVVAQKRPNAFGLYDMHGNASEWVQDVWHGDYRGAPSDGSAWLIGGNKVFRVLRGGAWSDYYPDDRRSARRSYDYAQGERNVKTGMRIARAN